MAFRESLGVEGLSNYGVQVGFRVGTAGTNLFGDGFGFILWGRALRVVSFGSSAQLLGLP